MDPIIIVNPNQPSYPGQTISTNQPLASIQPLNPSQLLGPLPINSEHTAFISHGVLKCWWGSEGFLLVICFIGIGRNGMSPGNPNPFMQ